MWCPGLGVSFLHDQLRDEDQRGEESQSHATEGEVKGLEVFGLKKKY